jgi:predicted ATPase
MGTVVVGREAELGAIEDLIGALGSGPTALVLEGEAGIGKTTVWDAGRDAARERGLRVLVCRGATAEVKLG